MALSFPYALYGYVYDKSGNPTANATITITYDGSVTGYSDSDGKYYINIQDVVDSGCTAKAKIKNSVGSQKLSTTFTFDIVDPGKSLNFNLKSSYRYSGNALIYYSCNQYPNYHLECNIGRWDENNYDITIETYMVSGVRDTLYRNLRPGAVRELYKVLGKPTFIDSTYCSANSIIISPKGGYNISSIRERRIVAVKSISDTFLTKNFFAVKIEGKILSPL